MNHILQYIKILKIESYNHKSHKFYLTFLFSDILFHSSLSIFVTNLWCKYIFKYIYILYIHLYVYTCFSIMCTCILHSRTEILYIYIILREYVNNIHFHFCYYKKLIFNQKLYFNLFMLLETQGYFNGY